MTARSTGPARHRRRTLRGSAARAGTAVAALAAAAALLAPGGGAGVSEAAAQEAVTTPVCRADLVVAPSGSCMYPGTDEYFAVDGAGRARFLFVRSFVFVEAPDFPVNSRLWHFAASSQGDGTWLIESVGDQRTTARRLRGSNAAFMWTAQHDLDTLSDDHGTPTGMHSDGETLWVADNATNRPDSVGAYKLADGQRAATVALADGNTAARGVWSNGDTLWVADGGADRVFAYSIDSGARQEAREFALADGNTAARGVWSNGDTLWVADAAGALFAYRLADGSPLGRHALDSANRTPHGLWSNGGSVWVADHEQARLFAYELPISPAGTTRLLHTPDDDFAALSAVGNGSPRGLWSDGTVMYVADAADDRVYSYNMPAGTRLEALTLTGMDIGEFRPERTAYHAAWDTAVSETTVEARAADTKASVTIEPADADGDAANGHQIDLHPEAPEAMFTTVAVTVTGEDGHSTRYRVALPNRTPEAFYSAALQELSRDGVLTGCASSGEPGADGFCGNDPIDRKTLAVWIVRTLDGEDPPAATGEARFGDVGDLPAAWRPFIERLAVLGHTTGCGDGANFCGDRTATRAEMAVLLSRAFDLPAGPDPDFADVADDAWYADHAARLKASGITVGCGDGANFCGDQITTRAQMATFLHRAAAYRAAASDAG